VRRVFGLSPPPTLARPAGEDAVSALLELDRRGRISGEFRGNPGHSDLSVGVGVRHAGYLLCRQSRPARGDPRWQRIACPGLLARSSGIRGDAEGVPARDHDRSGAGDRWREAAATSRWCSPSTARFASGNRWTSNAERGGRAAGRLPGGDGARDHRVAGSRLALPGSPSAGPRPVPASACDAVAGCPPGLPPTAPEAREAAPRSGPRPRGGWQRLPRRRSSAAARVSSRVLSHPGGRRRPRPASATGGGSGGGAAPPAPAPAPAPAGLAPGPIADRRTADSSLPLEECFALYQDKRYAEVIARPGSRSSGTRRWVAAARRFPTRSRRSGA